MVLRVEALRGRLAKLEEVVMADSWSDATWDGARRVHLEQGAAATPAQRLEWLEQAIELAHRTGALPREPSPG